MAPLTIPPNPCANGYELPAHQEEMVEARNFFKKMIDSPADQFKDVGSRDGLARYLYIGSEPAPTSIGTIKSITFIPDIHPIDVIACMWSTGYRLIWDTRIGEVQLMRRWNQSDMNLYVVLRGIGPIYWPRDFALLMRCWQYLPDGTVHNGGWKPEMEKAEIIATSVPGLDEQEGKVRGRMGVAGYLLEKVEGGTQVTFVINIDVNFNIPMYIRREALAESTLSVTRLRDAIPNFGIAPMVIDEHTCIYVHRHFWEPESKKSILTAHIAQAGQFLIRVDRQKMYDAGITMPRVDGPGAHSVSVSGATTPSGCIVVNVYGSGIGQEFSLSFEPISTERPAPSSVDGVW